MQDQIESLNWLIFCCTIAGTRAGAREDYRGAGALADAQGGVWDSRALPYSRPPSTIANWLHEIAEWTDFRATRSLLLCEPARPVMKEHCFDKQTEDKKVEQTKTLFEGNSRKSSGHLLSRCSDRVEVNRNC
jgi:hypothetical protein